MGRRATAVLAAGAFSVAALVAIACSSVAHTSGGGGGSDSVVAVYPLAGTPDASSSSEISFRGIDPDKLTKVNVVGSKSGRHAGKLEAHSDGMGASFVPAKPFAAGERVHVGANVRLVGQRGGSVSFRVAVPPNGIRPPKGFPDGAKPVVPGSNHFISRPDLHPPAVKVTVRSSSASDDYVFLAPKGGQGQNGPLILDSEGRTVWFHPVRRGFKTYDFRRATYEGKPVLTWWQGATAGRVRRRDRRDRGLVLPRDRDGQGRQRIPGGHPRVPRHSAGNGTDHGVPTRQLEHPAARRAARPRADRLDGARDRHQDGPRAVRVALARPYPPQGFLLALQPENRQPRRLHASQLRRARRRRQRPHLGA